LVDTGTLGRREHGGAHKAEALLDTGVLTQDEFDAQKQKILQSM
jgi:hypothetical protein